VNRRRFAWLALPALALALSGCAELQRIQVFTVSIVNDTPGAVVVRDCSGYCSRSLLTFHLAPGASVAVHRTTNEHKYFSVTSSSGAHLGCVDLFFRTVQPGASVDVSRARACPAHRRRWRTIGLLSLLLLGLAGVGAALLTRRRPR